MKRRYPNERRPAPTRAAIVGVLSIGRANAIPLRDLAAAIPSNPAPSVVRAVIREMQADGVGILTSPAAGVWMALDDGERLDVIDEIRHRIAALEDRCADINQGKCALRSCRAMLPKKVARRGGLYCRPEHRYQAAVQRTARAKTR